MEFAWYNSAGECFHQMLPPSIQPKSQTIRAGEPDKQRLAHWRWVFIVACLSASRVLPVRLVDDFEGGAPVVDKDANAAPDACCQHKVQVLCKRVFCQHLQNVLWPHLCPLSLHLSFVNFFQTHLRRQRELADRKKELHSLYSKIQWAMLASVTIGCPDTLPCCYLTAAPAPSPPAPLFALPIHELPGDHQPTNTCTHVSNTNVQAHARAHVGQHWHIMAYLQQHTSSHVSHMHTYLDVGSSTQLQTLAAICKYRQASAAAYRQAHGARARTHTHTHTHTR